MIQSNFLFFGTAFVLLQLLPGVVGWGKEDHYAVCKIAEEIAITQVEIKIGVPSVELTTIPCSYRIISAPLQNGNVITITLVLYSAAVPQLLFIFLYVLECDINKIFTSLNTDNLTEALMFLSHFIGDAHQPLHAGFRGDLGGNTISVHWFGLQTNLHRVWDNMIIETAMKSFYNSDLAIMIESINKNITDTWSEDIILWENCTSINTICPDPYASESIDLACKYAYKGATPGSTLSDEYFLSRLPIVEKRLAQAGVRLASTLNRIFKTQMLISEA
ncbi:hypothetical protein C5167_039385 [Papaver somniferum]|uniref:Aspergillus nuclease S1 n=1 Tax=Papaver somniferum TaxID=3469 RepID=A0A4Y7IBZ0_PAPSO|nr:hypothetical protein C5167_039385 [Papaver somniferum]